MGRPFWGGPFSRWNLKWLESGERHGGRSLRILLEIFENRRRTAGAMPPALQQTERRGRRSLHEIPKFHTPRIPHVPNSIRRAETSDRSSGPNGVIQPPACQNELAPGPAGRPVERGQWCHSTTGLPERIVSGDSPQKNPPIPKERRISIKNVRIPYAEREPATGRAVSARLTARKI